MRTIMKITDPSLWVECKYDEAASPYPYRLYMLYRATGRNGYPTVHREQIERCSTLHEVLDFLACIEI